MCRQRIGKGVFGHHDSEKFLTKTTKERKYEDTTDKILFFDKSYIEEEVQVNHRAVQISNIY